MTSVLRIMIVPLHLFALVGLQYTVKRSMCSTSGPSCRITVAVSDRWGAICGFYALSASLADVIGHGGTFSEGNRGAWVTLRNGAQNRSRVLGGLPLMLEREAPLGWTADG